MTTSNGYNFSIKGQICTLEIPKNEGCFSAGVCKAKNEIWQNETITYISEIKIKKV
jgi:hypothetical protein